MAIDPVSLAITAALTAASMAMNAMNKIKGPRLDSLDVTLSEYGTPIPRFWGKRRIDPQFMWAEKLREKKKTTKGKGGKYTEYNYFGTWAVLICDHEIDSVARIWFDKHLVYQMTGAGPVSPVLGLFEGPFGIEVKLGTGTNMRTYLGTEDQLADPRMEAWCEDRYGVGSCPAYRSSAYIVFEEIPLEKFGNRLPQITVEVINNKTDSFPWESHVREGDMGSGFQFSDGFDAFVIPYHTDGFEVWDVATRTRLAAFPSPVDDLSGHEIGVTTGGAFYAVNGFPSQELWLISPTGGATLVVEPAGFPEYAQGCSFVGGRLYILPYVAPITAAMYLGGTTIIAVDVGFTVTHYFADVEGAEYGVGYNSGVDGFKICTLPEGVASPTIASSLTGAAYAMDNGKGQFVVWQAASMFLVDPDTWTIIDSVSAVTGSEPDVVFRNIRPGAFSIWMGDKEYSAEDLSIIQTVVFADWTAEDVDTSVYDPVNHALIGQPQIDMNLTWRFLNRVGSDGVQLADVVDDVSGWCGLTGQDTTALTQIVLGYSVTQGTGKDILATLFDIYDVDPRPHDFLAQFVNRGGSPLGTIPTAEFVREGDDSRYTVSIQQDTDLPRRLTYNFADEGKDQQTNTVIAQRPLDAMDSNREESIDLTTFVDTPDGAQQKADRHFRRLWNSRERISNGLTAKRLALEPGDVTTISLDGVNRTVRLDKMTIKGLVLDCEFVRDETNFAALNVSAGAPMDGRDPEVIYVPSRTQGFIIDAPLVADVDNETNPVIYYAAGQYGGTWPGAGVYRGDDGTYDELFGFVESADDATWATAEGVLATANPNLWDRGNTVSLIVFGTLISSTEAAIDADPTINFCAFGVGGRWEYLNFTTATLTGTNGLANVYTLSGFKRGRRGTEENVGNHAMGDLLVVMEEVANAELGADELGANMSFKIQTVGRSIDDAYPLNLTYTGASLKPYAPAVQSIIKDSASGDITVDFDRRTRIGGNWNGSAIPLGEATEAYELDVLDTGVAVRTLTATTSSFIYTAAQQTTDFGAPIAANDLDAELYQMSATVGRGYAATV